MSITRREFTKALARTTAAGISLTILGQFGCEDEPTSTSKRRKVKANLATEPFTIGPISQFDKPGVYDQYKQSHGVWIVRDNGYTDGNTDSNIDSNTNANGPTLVALSATCTHVGCSVDWDLDIDQFQCPCHESGFTRQGINMPDARASRPLERCTIQRILAADSPDADATGHVIQIDPTVRFRHDKNEWDNPASMLHL